MKVKISQLTSLPYTNKINLIPESEEEERLLMEFYEQAKSAEFTIKVGGYKDEGEHLKKLILYGRSK